MKNYRFVAVALALAVFPLLALGIMGFAATDAMAAPFDFWSSHGEMLRVSLLDNMQHAWPALIALRTDLDGLTKKAAAKIAEIKDDTAPDAARSIEGEHTELLALITAKRKEIADEEALGDPATRNQPSNQPNAANTSVNDAARAADILDVGTRASMATDVIQEAIRSGLTLDAFRQRAFDHMTSQQNGNRTDPVRVLRDEQETRRNLQIEALSYRMGAPIPAAGPSAGARERMNDGLIVLAMDCTQERNYPRNPRQIEELFERASHTTSDFPIILENSLNRTLEQRYALAQPTYRRISRQRNFRDFRPHTTVKMGDFPLLEKIAEDGEIKYGTLSEGKETLSVLSYAKALSVSRQLMINDDLGAINDMLSSYGQTVALFEEITFYASALNGTLADGNAVFHASHANLAGSGTAITVAAVAAGRAAMAKQKSLDGHPLLSNPPALILTGPDKITEAEALVRTITPSTVAEVNVFSGRLTPFDTAQVSGNNWYLFADPSVGSNYRWGYLEGYEAPRVRLDTPFGRQGMAMSVEHDFGAGAVDFRFGYKNTGA